MEREVAMSQDTLPTFMCPACKSELCQDSEGWRCEACNQEFPCVLGTLPLLVSNAQTYLAGERMVLAHLANEYQTVAERYVIRANQGGLRAETLRELASGLEHNAGYLNNLLAQLPESQITLSQYMPTLGTDLFGGLRKDWSGAQEAEHENRITCQAISEALHKFEPSETLVLGAGTGRLSCDLAAEFPKVVSLELSLAVAASYVLLTKHGTIDAFHLYTGNFRKAAEEAERFVASRSLSSGVPSYLVADATQIPFADGSFDAVVSPYFSDLIPFSRLLPEVWRVLKPKGHFIHFGTLGYAHDDETQYYAVDQLSAAFRQHGFEFQSTKFVPNTFSADERRLNELRFDNLLFTAQRVEPTTQPNSSTPAAS